MHIFSDHRRRVAPGIWRTEEQPVQSGRIANQVSEDARVVLSCSACCTSVRDHQRESWLGGLRPIATCWLSFQILLFVAIEAREQPNATSKSGRCRTCADEPKA